MLKAGVIKTLIFLTVFSILMISVYAITVPTGCWDTSIEDSNSTNNGAFHFKGPSVSGILYEFPIKFEWSTPSYVNTAYKGNKSYEVYLDEVLIRNSSEQVLFLDKTCNGYCEELKTGPHMLKVISRPSGCGSIMGFYIANPPYGDVGGEEWFIESEKEQYKEEGYSYRIPVEVDVPNKGDYVLENSDQINKFIAGLAENHVYQQYWGQGFQYLMELSNLKSVEYQKNNIKKNSKDFITPALTGKELIKNGDFESDLGSEWGSRYIGGYWGIKRSKDAARSGKYGLKLNEKIWQNISKILEPGEESNFIQATFFAKNTGTESLTVTAWISNTNQDLKYIAIPADKEWHEVNLLVSPPMKDVVGGNRDIRLVIAGDIIREGPPLYIDDVSVKRYKPKFVVHAEDNPGKKKFYLYFNSPKKTEMYSAHLGGNKQYLPIYKTLNPLPSAIGQPEKFADYFTTKNVLFFKLDDPFDYIGPYSSPKNPDQIIEKLPVQMAGGEFESAALGIYSKEDIEVNDIILGDDLKGEKGLISKGDVEIWISKPWLQSDSIGHENHGLYSYGAYDTYNSPKIYNDLLVKDDRIFFNDRSTNIRIEGPVQTTLNQFMTKKLWITVHAPETTPPGNYEAPLTLQTNKGEFSVVLDVEILPFKLEYKKPVNGIYTTHGLCNSNGTGCGLNDVTPEVNKKMIKNIVDYGLGDIIFLGGLGDFCNLDNKLQKQQLDIIKEAGVKGVVVHAWPYRLCGGKNVTLIDAAEKIRSHGLEPWAYIIDEHNVNSYARKVAILTDYAQQDAGMKAMIANNQGLVSERKIISTANISYDYCEVEAGAADKCGVCDGNDSASCGTTGDFTLYNEANYKFRYFASPWSGPSGILCELLPNSNPLHCEKDERVQRNLDLMNGILYYGPSGLTGNNDPNTIETGYYFIYIDPIQHNRYYSGFYVGVANFDGVFPFLYSGASRSNQNDIFNDFDGVSVEGNTVYYVPPSIGPILTEKWEAVREGLDDLKYMETLINRINYLEKNTFEECIENKREVLEYINLTFRYTSPGIFAPENFTNARKKIINALSESGSTIPKLKVELVKLDSGTPIPIPGPENPKEINLVTGFFEWVNERLNNVVGLVVRNDKNLGSMPKPSLIIENVVVNGKYIIKNEGGMAVSAEILHRLKGPKIIGNEILKEEVVFIEADQTFSNTFSHQLGELGTDEYNNMEICITVNAESEQRCPNAEKGFGIFEACRQIKFLSEV